MERAPSVLEAGETYGATGVSLFSQHSATIDWIGDPPLGWDDEGTYPMPSTVPFEFNDEDVDMGEDGD